jgi:hypothetical protein
VSVFSAVVSNELTALRVLVPYFTGIRAFVRNCVDSSTRVSGELSRAFVRNCVYSSTRVSGELSRAFVRNCVDSSTRVSGELSRGFVRK